MNGTAGLLIALSTTYTSKAIPMIKTATAETIKSIMESKGPRIYNSVNEYQM